MKTTKQLLCVGGLLWLGAVAQAQDDPDLIDVTSLEQLDAIRYDLNGDGIADDPAKTRAYETAFPSLPLRRYEGYELTTNLDFAGTKWAEGSAATDAIAAGWKPIGVTSPFAAIFEGNDNTISNLYINRSGAVGGLFGYIGGYAEIRNLALKEVSVTVTLTVRNGTNAYAYAGGLVGGSSGTISGCSTTGNADATASASTNHFVFASAGGLVGSSLGTISDCYATGNATATATSTSTDYFAFAGGLVGSSSSSGTISDCYATGNADATATTSNASTGGLAGHNSGTISDCYATGNADATEAAYAFVGGLVGWNDEGSISGCYATGNANADNTTATTGNAYAGGLVGHNSGTISGCHATGNANASGDSYASVSAGGLVGDGDSISGCYATGNAEATATTGDAYAGGLVGNGDSISGCYATGNAEAIATTGDASAGGLVGLSFGTISVCYATGNADATASTANAYAGGFVGGEGASGNITACYSIGDATATGNTTFVGGFEGYSEGRISKSYFDHETSNRPETDIGAQTTSALQSPTNYTGIYKDWNITSTTEDGAEFVLWSLCEGAEYPKLSADFDGNGTPSVDEFGPQGSCSLPPGTPDPATPPSGTDERVTALEAENAALKAEDVALKAEDIALKAEDVALKAEDVALKAEDVALKAEDIALKAEDIALKAELEALKAKIAAFEAATGGQSTAIYNVPEAGPSNVQAYPNPAKHSLLFANLTPGRVYLYKIYTSSGVLLRSDAIQSDEAIDISTLEAGQHLLVLQDDASREVLRSSLLIE